MPRPVAESRQEGFDIRHWARLVWRRKWLLLAIVVAIPSAVYALSSLLPKTYESEATINVKATAVASTLFSGQISSSSNTGQTQTLIQTTVVARRAARLLGEKPSEGRALLSHISVAPTNPSDSTGEFLTITARDSDPVMAARIANAFAEATAQTRASEAVRNIDRTIKGLISQGGVGDKASRDALALQLQQLRGLKAGQTGTTPVVEPAVPSSAPISPQPQRNTTIAFILALLLAAALAPLLDRMDRRIREPRELENLLEPPLLATVPDEAFPGHQLGPHVREAFQTLRANLTYFNIDRPLSTLVVASPGQQDGKTTVAINLAIAYALDGSDVILVDADLRRPQIAPRLGKEVGVGLDALLVGERTLEEVLVDVDAGPGARRLRILPGATPPPNPAALLGSQRMRSLLDELAGQADIVLIDSPALLAVSDALPLINQAAGTVLVARLNQTTKDAVERTNQVITAAGGTVLGTVATGAQAGGLYGYYGYGYYNTDDDRGDKAQSSNGVGPQPHGSEQGAEQRSN
jgi:capsular exopolysaccharide synthesis family protein